jgi:hypothetical protein
MLTVNVLRIDEVLWNSAFMIEIPGAMIDEHKGLDVGRSGMLRNSSHT